MGRVGKFEHLAGDGDREGVVKTEASETEDVLLPDFWSLGRGIDRPNDAPSFAQSELEDESTGNVSVLSLHVDGVENTQNTGEPRRPQGSRPAQVTTGSRRRDAGCSG